MKGQVTTNTNHSFKLYHLQHNVQKGRLKQQNVHKTQYLQPFISGIQWEEGFRLQYIQKHPIREKAKTLSVAKSSICYFFAKSAGRTMEETQQEMKTAAVKSWQSITK